MSATSSDSASHASPPAAPAHPAGGARAGGDPARRSPGLRARATLACVLLLLGAVLGAVLTGTVLGIGALPAVADTTPSPTPSAPALSGTVDAFLSPTANGIHREGQPLMVWAVLRNGSAYTVAESDVAVSVGTTPIAGRGALSIWLTDGDDHALVPVGSGSLEAVEPGQSARSLITVPADNPTVQALSAPGVYPVQATITGASQTRTVRSVIVVPPAQPSTRTPVGLIVPITAGALPVGLLSADQLTTLTAPTGELTEQLNAVSGTDAILAVDPAILAAIRVLGDSAPASAKAWLERLSALPNERFALQFGDADVAAQTRSGHTSLLEPLPLTSYMSAENFRTTGGDDTASTPTATPAPSPSGAPVEPELPTLAQLEDLGEAAHPGVVWPFSGTATPVDVTALGGMTVAGSPTLTLLPSAGTEGGADAAAVPAHGTTGTANVLVYDSAVSDALRDASQLEDPTMRGQSLATASGYLQLGGDAVGAQPMLVVVDRAASRSGLGLSAAVAAVEQAPTAVAADLAVLTGAPAVPVTVTDAVTDDPRTAALQTLEQGEAQLGSFATILDDPTVLTGPERASILQLIGSGWLGDPDAWTAALADHREQTATTLGSVSVAPTSTINLAGTSAPLRFGVRNDLPWRVHVTLLASPDNLRVEVQPSTEVTAHADSTTRVSVPVRARIGSGPVGIDLRLVSPTGVPIGQPYQVQVNVHADWEVIGLSVMGAGVAAFLVLGLIRTVRTRRRARAAVPPENDHEDGENP